jgi:hypothetical protein
MLGDLDTPGGLQLVKTQTIGTAVSSVTVSDVFSADFDNYRIIVSGGVASTTNSFNLTFGSTATGYYLGATNVVWAGTVTGVGVSNGTSIASGFGTADALSVDLTVCNPFSAKVTTFYGNNIRIETGASGAVRFLSGYLNNTTSYTSFTFTANTGTWTGGTIRVYGYRNA